MPQRLSDQFQINDRVEIYLGAPALASAPALAGLPDEAGWQAGTVVGRQHPGLWVAALGTFWFVTNNRHIRPAPASTEAPKSRLQKS